MARQCAISRRPLELRRENARIETAAEHAVPRSPVVKAVIVREENAWDMRSLYREVQTL